MNFVFTIPALVKIAVIFAAIVLLIRKKISLASAFLAGALLVALFFMLPLRASATAVFNGLFHPKTISLCIIVALIIVFSSSMEQYGQLRRLLTSFQGLVRSPRLNLSIFPALIGLLPMPGGAVFSAPMVKEIGNRSGLSGATLSYINYWFRHIWEYWWPMYPGILLATVLADINLPLFMGLMFPLTLVVMRIGWLPVGKFNLTAPPPHPDGRPPVKPFLKEIAPILVVIGAGLLIGWLVSLGFPKLSVAKETGLVVSLCAGIFLVWRANRIPWKDRRAIMISPQVFKIVYMVVAIMIFKEVLYDSGAVDAVSMELVGLGIPLALICAVLPFIVGLLTGITIAFVGSAFPILISLITSQDQAHLMIPYFMLALSCGFAGVLLSPLHLCLLLSNSYFKTSLQPVYRLLWRPCIYLVVCSVLYFLLVRWALPWG
ncbi:DUF401 family protein [Desulfosudis oleivorans]|uniref:DUF401 family protein n=1 Tax=Desulfosudis oleivorans (strain DSM 6200 / JCM 39069 / Hxd3) TaxID=96561 RepID=A8ZX33_DESOH|nr:DUF401 family protein [Desulfosudis oleivorans]ABW66889.1 protein of unknown function DUF401 [Desulfosudis oleivorans Hxd3]